MNEPNSGPRTEVAAILDDRPIARPPAYLTQDETERIVKEAQDQQAPEFDLAIVYQSGASRPARDLADDLSPANLDVYVQEKEPAMIAGVEWLLASPIVIFIGKYVGTLGQEAAKEHYPLVKRAMVRFLTRTVGKAREIYFQSLVSAASRNKLSGERPAAVSVYATLRSGHRVKFAFDDTMAELDHGKALDDLLDSLQRHSQAGATDELGSLAGDASRGSPIVMRFDKSTGRWRHWRREDLIRGIPPS